MIQSLSLAFSPRFICLTLALLLALGFGTALMFSPGFWTGLGFIIAAALSALGLRDLFHPSHAILRNYPIAAHLRFIMEEIRPEMRQYFFEDEKHGTPFSRDKRAIVYQRAKKQLDKRPFGTQYDVYDTGFEWLQHSLAARPPAHELPRILIGGPACTKPYSASLLNISAMSFGSLSANAIRALNQGAKRGGFAHDTGEGGLSPYHREAGGDLIWEIGSGYFSARNPDGSFSPDRGNGCAGSGENGGVETQPRCQARPWRRAARRKSQCGNRRYARRADGAGLCLPARA